MSGWTLLNSLTMVSRPLASSAVPRIATRSASAPRPGTSAAVRRGHAAAVPITPAPAAIRKPRRLRSAIAPPFACEQAAAAGAVEQLHHRGVDDELDVVAGPRPAAGAEAGNELGARRRHVVHSGVLCELVELGAVQFVPTVRVEVGIE